MPRALNASVQELARIKPRSARVMAGSWRMARLIIFGKLESVGNDNHDTQKMPHKKGANFFYDRATRENLLQL